MAVDNILDLGYSWISFLYEFRNSDLKNFAEKKNREFFKLPFEAAFSLKTR